MLTNPLLSRACLSLPKTVNHSLQTRRDIRHQPVTSCQTQRADTANATRTRAYVREKEGERRRDRLRRCRAASSSGMGSHGNWAAPRTRIDDGNLAASMETRPLDFCFLLLLLGHHVITNVLLPSALLVSHYYFGI